MSFWRKLFRRKNKNGSPYVSLEDTEQTIPVFHRENINIHDKKEREQYIRSCLEQISDSEIEMRHLE